MHVLISAHSKAPAGTSLFETYKHIGVVLEVETTDSVVIDAELVFVSEITRRFFRNLIVGYKLSDGADGLVRAIEAHYIAPSKSAVITAVRTAVSRYNERFNATAVP